MFNVLVQFWIATYICADFSICYVVDTVSLQYYQADIDMYWVNIVAFEQSHIKILLEWFIRIEIWDPNKILK